jgi:mediator of RNA polymerase II transcription subunit 13
VEAEGINLSIKQSGTYDSSTILGAARSAGYQNTSKSDLPSPLTPYENQLWLAQSANAKAANDNAALLANRESRAISNLNVGSDELLSYKEYERIHEYFIVAVLSSLSYRLCHDSGYMALNSRTLVLPDAAYAKRSNSPIDAAENELLDDRMQVITLDVVYTGNKTLVIKASISPSIRFLYVNHPGCIMTPEDIIIPEDTALLLGPGGNIARYKSIVTENSKAGKIATYDSSNKSVLENESPNSTAFQRWKRRCLFWLKQKGLDVDTLNQCPWLMVEAYVPLASGTQKHEGTELPKPEEDLIPLYWPALLCFRQANAGPNEYKTYGSLSNYDPLEFAQGWYTSRIDREATMAKRRKERESAAAAIKAQVDINSPDTKNVYSPMALNRASLAGTVYPTPPDAIQNAVGATPSFDGNASTPVPANHQLLLPDTGGSVGRAVAEATEKLWPSSDPRKDHQMSDPDFQDTSNGNLFGDMGDDLFGEENNITDADFSFFDEPDIFQHEQSNDNSDGGTDNSNANPPSQVEEEKPTDIKSATAVSTNASGDKKQMHGTDKGLAVSQISEPPTEYTSSGSKDVVMVDINTALRPKPSSPPLNPDMVFRRLSTADILSHPHIQKAADASIREFGSAVSSFRGVDFNPALSALTEKYGAHGRFVYPTKTDLRSPTQIELPRTNYLARRRQRKPNSHDSASHVFLLASENVSMEPDEYMSSDDDYSTLGTSSDQDEGDQPSPVSPFIASPRPKKRKRGDNDVGDLEEPDEMSSSFRELKVDQGASYEDSHLDLLNPSLLDSDPASWSLARLLNCPEGKTKPPALADLEFIAAAQILGDQAVSRIFQVAEADGYNDANGSLRVQAERLYIPDVVSKDLLEATKSYFIEVSQCTLASVLEIQGMPPPIRPLNNMNRLPQRPMVNPRTSQVSEPPKVNPVFLIPPPHLEVRRSDSRLSVLPSAIPFWDVLGLAPCRSVKDIAAVCVYPNSVGMTDYADAFLEHIRSAYETRRLGNHERFVFDGHPEGLFAVELGGATAQFASDYGLSIIRDGLFQIAQSIASAKVEGKNYVLYVIYDAKIPEHIVPICAAFHSMFELYRNLISDQKPAVTTELVLQLVPLDMVASQTSLVIPPPTAYARLAMEVYDRCVEFDSGALTPSITIEQSLPRTIDFKLTANPSESLLHENSCLHVAYAQSIDDRWVTAAWSDSLGNEQMTASYCLGRPNAPLSRGFSDIAHEIWETTLEVISARKVHWRILITKCGVIEPAEEQFWRGLAATESTAQVSLTILTVETQPSLQLLPPSISLQASSIISQSTFYTTPVSTPQTASFLSPDQSGNPATPSREGTSATPSDATAEVKIEPDAILVDITDETYGAILSYRNYNSNSPLEQRPALISGYLIKRSGAGATDIPIVLEVNIIWTEVNPRMLEPFLKEILGWYRGLATLARVRGLIDPVKDARPWHIAAAEKAVRSLYFLM